MQRSICTAALLALIAPLTSARADGLAGSPASMVHQHRVAVSEAYSFLRTPADVQKLAASGALVPIVDGPDLTLSNVSFPFARPEVRDFVGRFAALYHAATGSPLVVTSLTRPESKQPSNAHVLSVHPAGMAVDLRVPENTAARTFLESSLLAMEKAGVLDVTREHTPAHYHVAVFAGAYEAWAARQDSAATALPRVDAAVHGDSVQRVAGAVPPSAADADTLASALLGLFVLAALLAPVTVAPSRRRPAGR